RFGFGGGGGSATKKQKKGRKGKKGKNKAPKQKMPGGFPGGLPGGMPGGMSGGGGTPDLSQLGGGLNDLPPGFDPSKLKLPKNKWAMFHVRGMVLPEGRERDVWTDGDRISLTPVDGATTLDGAFVLPGLVDAHCHPGIGVDGPVTLDEAAAQATADRDAGTLLIRDCGVPIDIRPLQERVELPRIIRKIGRASCR